MALSEFRDICVRTADASTIVTFEIRCKGDVPPPYFPGKIDSHFEKLLELVAGAGHHSDEWC